MTKVVMILLGIILFVGCNGNAVFDQNKSCPNGWHKDSIVTFELPKMEEKQRYNLFFNIRNSEEYPFNNLFLIGEIRFPNGKIVKDTLEYRMTNSDGSWLGEGFTGVIENKLFYKQNVLFTENGNYEVSLKQAMRSNGSVQGLEKLDGITDVGFSIEKAVIE